MSSAPDTNTAALWWFGFLQIRGRCLEGVYGSVEQDRHWEMPFHRIQWISEKRAGKGSLYFSLEKVLD